MRRSAVTAAAALVAAAAGTALGVALDHLACTVWPRMALGVAVCAFAVAAAVTARRSPR